MFWNERFDLLDRWFNDLSLHKIHFDDRSIHLIPGLILLNDGFGLLNYRLIYQIDDLCFLIIVKLFKLAIWVSWSSFNSSNRRFEFLLRDQKFFLAIWISFQRSEVLFTNRKFFSTIWVSFTKSEVLFTNRKLFLTIGSSF